MNSVIVTAAGSGKRMGDTYKQFFEIKGKPLVYFSVIKFMDSGIEEIIIVVPEEKIEYTSGIFKEFNNSVTVVKGGERRQDSVRNGLMKSSGDIILVHDGVRPFISTELIERVIKCTDKYGVCAPGIPMTNTVKLYTDDRIMWTLNRNSMLQVQTPQGFKSEMLKDVIELLKGDSVTDELSIMESLNMDIHWVMGDKFNIKVTYPEDMKLAEIIAGSMDIK